jgi:response regulator RpfG family c-di-GMP phosphodiesterase
MEMSSFQLHALKAPITRVHDPALTPADIHTAAGGHVVAPRFWSSSRAALLARGRRSASLSFVLAGLLGFAERDRTSIALAANMCDVGMMFVPQRLAQNGETLGATERQIVEGHVRAGHDLLLHYAKLTGRDLSLEAAIVLAHHERYDGQGYPHSLAGRYIPRGARIVAIADAFIGLTSEGAPVPCTRAEALEKMTVNSGSVFDPHYFEVFKKIVDLNMDLLFREYAKLFGSTSRLSELALGIHVAGAALAKADHDFLG